MATSGKRPRIVHRPDNLHARRQFQKKVAKIYKVRNPMQVQNIAISHHRSEMLGSRCTIVAEAFPAWTSRRAEVLAERSKIPTMACPLERSEQRRRTLNYRHSITPHGQQRGFDTGLHKPAA